MAVVPEDKIRISTLLDYYGYFLTTRQRCLLDQWVNEDCSLSEIAERENISRQAVSDSLRHAEKTLSEMEDNLGLLRRSAAATQVIHQLREDLSKAGLQPDVLAQLNAHLDRLADIQENNNYGI